FPAARWRAGRARVRPPQGPPAEQALKPLRVHSPAAMGAKKERLGPRLAEAARSGERYRDAHMFLGGTGAVGGTALLQMLSMYEEMLAISAPAPDDVPVLVATGTTAAEIQAFTRRLFRFVESRHGADRLPERV